MQSSGKLYQIQYLRALAAVAVVFYHINATLQGKAGIGAVNPFTVGAAGVDLFFVISGFIMAYVASGPKKYTSVQFLRERLVRVAPLYYLVTLFVFACLLIVPQLFYSSTAHMEQLFDSLLFLPFQHEEGWIASTVTVGWTLNYEMMFYVLVALSVGVFKDRQLITTCAILFGLFVLGRIVHFDNKFGRVYTDPIILEFVLGIASFHIYRSATKLSGKVLFPVLLVSGIAILLMQNGAEYETSRLWRFGIPSAMILLALVNMPMREYGMLSNIGDWSYSLYLTHIFIVAIMLRLVTPYLDQHGLAGFAVQLIIALIAVCAAAITHMMIEKPIAAIHRNGMKRAQSKPECVKVA